MQYEEFDKILFIINQLSIIKRYSLYTFYTFVRF